jgi:hypothetical protein
MSDEEFNNVCMREEDVAAIAAQAGTEHGTKLAQEQGYELGITKGSHLGVEVTKTFAGVCSSLGRLLLGGTIRMGKAASC